MAGPPPTKLADRPGPPVTGAEVGRSRLEQDKIPTTDRRTRVRVSIGRTRLGGHVSHHPHLGVVDSVTGPSQGDPWLCEPASRPECHFSNGLRRTSSGLRARVGPRGEAPSVSEVSRHPHAVNAVGPPVPEAPNTQGRRFVV